MGLFKKFYGCHSCGRRVRQKPARVRQLDMFGDYNNEVLYVRSFEEETQDVSRFQSASVQRGSSMDSSNECSQRPDARWI